MDIDKQPIETQEKWLVQRGWQERSRPGVKMWADPDSGVAYVHCVAMRRALEAAKLPGDFQLNPVTPPPIR